MQIPPTQWSAASAAATPISTAREAHASAKDAGGGIQAANLVEKSEQSQDRDANESYSNHQRRPSGTSNSPTNSQEPTVAPLLDLAANDESNPSVLDLRG